MSFGWKRVVLASVATLTLGGVAQASELSLNVLLTTAANDSRVKIIAAVNTGPSVVTLIATMGGLFLSGGSDGPIGVGTTVHLSPNVPIGSGLSSLCEAGVTARVARSSSTSG